MPCEPITLSLGLVALASLFTTCIECFEYVNKAQSFGEDSKILLVQFELEQARFLIWGQSIGLNEIDDVENNDERIAWAIPEKFLQLIKVSLNVMVSLLTDADQLVSRYGLKSPGPGQVAPDRPTTQRVGLTSLVRLKGLCERYQDRSNTHHSQLTAIKKLRWAIHDCNKFANLIQDFRQVVDRLYDLTDSPITKKLRADLAAEKIQSIQDEATLRLLVEGTADLYPDVCGLATEMLESSLAYEGSEKMLSESDNQIFAYDEQSMLDVSGSIKIELGRRPELTLDVYKALVDIQLPTEAIMGIAAMAIEENNLDQMRDALSVIYKVAEYTHSVCRDIDVTWRGMGRNLDPMGGPFCLKDLRSFLLSNFKDKELAAQKDFSVIVTKALRRLIVRAEFGASIDFQTAVFYYGQTDYFQGNESHVSRILINVLHNAFKFTPALGRVNVRIFCEDPEFLEALSQNSFKKSQWIGKQVLITFKISDTRIGVPPLNQDKIFEPCFKTCNESIGLGLPCAHRLAQSIGGSVQYQKPETGFEKGSVFIVKIPLTVVKFLGDEGPEERMVDEWMDKCQTSEPNYSS